VSDTSVTGGSAAPGPLTRSAAEVRLLLAPFKP